MRKLVTFVNEIHGKYRPWRLMVAYRDEWIEVKVEELSPRRESTPVSCKRGATNGGGVPRGESPLKALPPLGASAPLLTLDVNNAYLPRYL